MEFQERVKELTDIALSKRNDLFLIDLSISSSNAIKVVIDGDNGVRIEDCMEISRGIEHQLDRDDEDFSLEVTSYGITEPLLVARQYVKNIGRTLKIKPKEDKEIKGELKDANEEFVILETKSREPKPVGKGKTTVIKEHKIALTDIDNAKVVIKF